METRHVSAHYARRCERQRGHYKRRYPKFTCVCDTKTHIFLSGFVDRGPLPDCIEFSRTVYDGWTRHRFHVLLGDSGYESEGNHELCRDRLGITSIIPSTRRGRPRHDGGQLPICGKYRKQLHRRFPKKLYGQRWQVETAFSMIKRNMGSAMTARRPYSINRELMLRVLTHNLMIIRRQLTFSTEQDCHQYCSIGAYLRFRRDR
jgi:hypothetical protein